MTTSWQLHTPPKVFFIWSFADKRSLRNMNTSADQPISHNMWSLTLPQAQFNMTPHKTMIFCWQVRRARETWTFLPISQYHTTWGPFKSLTWLLTWQWYAKNGNWQKTFLLGVNLAPLTRTYLVILWNGGLLALFGSIVRGQGTHKQQWEAEGEE